MMTQQLEVSILAAPVAAIDRRAISQAWYSALRYAAAPQHGAVTGAAIGSSASPRNGLRHDAWVSPHRTRFESAGSPRGRAVVPTTRPTDEAGRLKSRRVAPPLAVRIERAFGGGATSPKRVTFSLGRGSARVHVILQTKGDCIMLVALCTPELRGVVGSALTQARRALAGRNISLAPHRTGSAACS
jgi:hypothetical protein